MKEKTAVQTLIDDFPDISQYIPLGITIQLHARFQQALELEKKQIVDAYNEGVFEENSWYINDIATKPSAAETYFTDTYEQPK